MGVLVIVAEPNRLKCTWHQTAHIFEPYLQEGTGNPAFRYLEVDDKPMIRSTAMSVIKWIDGMVPALDFEEKYFQDNVDRFNLLAAYMVMYYSQDEAVKVYLKMKFNIIDVRL